jgi:hypothetical protein
MRYSCCVRITSLILALPLAATALAAVAEAPVDPIGVIRQTGHYAADPRILTGRDATGEPVCYVLEQGDSHRLQIGTSAKGAFVRLDTPEPRDLPVPQAPVRIYAGLQQTAAGRATDRFAALKTFSGEVAYGVPRADQGGFVLVASSEIADFLAVVAAAKGNFLVVDSRSGEARDYVAVYEFDQRAAEALIACRPTH